MSGLFITDADGNFSFKSTKPVSYELPTDGSCGELLKLFGMSDKRPSHFNFNVSSPGYQRVRT